jgi:hypothetical protein
MKAGTWDLSHVTEALPACRAIDRPDRLDRPSPLYPLHSTCHAPLPCHFLWMDDRRETLMLNPARSHLVGPDPWAGQVGRAVELQGGEVSVVRGVLVAVVVG